MQFSSRRFFRKTMQILIDILIIYIILVMGIGLLKTLYGIHLIFTAESIGDSFNRVITDILTFLVLIELFRSFIEYFEMHRFRLHTLVTPALVFVLRELIVMLYSHEINALLLMAFGFVILALGAVRTLGVYFTPTENIHEEQIET